MQNTPIKEQDRDAMGKRVAGAGGVIRLVKEFCKIILESDSSLAIDLINKNKIINDKNYNLIMQKRDLLVKNWDIQVIQVYKKTNSITD